MRVSRAVLKVWGTVHCDETVASDRLVVLVVGQGSFLNPDAARPHAKQRRAKQFGDNVPGV